MNTQGRLVTEEEFGDVIVKTGSQGQVTRLRDVARVEMDASSYSLMSLLNNKPAVAISVLEAPGANAIEISDQVRAKMDELAKRFPEARLLFTGGSGALRDLAGAEASEADMAGRFFHDQGVSPERLLLEGQSRNTAENARLSLALAAPAPGETWVLVTSAFHMPRAMRSFETAGWTGLVPWPVDYRTSAFKDGMGWNLTRNLLVLNTAIREQVGQIAYRLTSR